MDLNYFLLFVIALDICLLATCDGIPNYGLNPVKQTEFKFFDFI